MDTRALANEWKNINTRMNCVVVQEKKRIAYMKFFVILDDLSYCNQKFKKLVVLVAMKLILNRRNAFALPL